MLPSLQDNIKTKNLDNLTQNLLKPIDIIFSGNLDKILQGLNHVVPDK